MSIFYKIAPHLESLGGELLTSLGADLSDASGIRNFRIFS